MVEKTEIEGKEGIDEIGVIYAKRCK